MQGKKSENECPITSGKGGGSPKKKRVARRGGGEGHIPGPSRIGLTGRTG